MTPRCVVMPSTVSARRVFGEFWKSASTVQNAAKASQGVEERVAREPTPPPPRRLSRRRRRGLRARAPVLRARDTEPLSCVRDYTDIRTDRIRKSSSGYGSCFATRWRQSNDGTSPIDPRHRHGENNLPASSPAKHILHTLSSFPPPFDRRRSRLHSRSCLRRSSPLRALEAHRATASSSRSRSSLLLSLPLRLPTRPVFQRTPTKRFPHDRSLHPSLFVHVHVPLTSNFISGKVRPASPSACSTAN